MKTRTSQQRRPISTPCTDNKARRASAIITWCILTASVEKGRAEWKKEHMPKDTTRRAEMIYIGGLDQEGHPKDTRTCEQKATLLQLLKDLKIRYPSANLGT